MPPAQGLVLQHTFTFKNPVTAVAFGRGLSAAGDKEGVLVLWDPKTGKQKDAIKAFEKGRGIGAATEAESIDLAQAAGVPVLPIRRHKGAVLWRLG